VVRDAFIQERASQGLTMRELADKSGVPIGTISRAESGRPISVKSASKLCGALGKEFKQLFIIEVD
ncbi:MAG: helix-turn-helix transcriptional regulator, partial [Lachnospiraceae bacterium]|nr:helix-turn-helix transcriptional regulator [Lachnospiraceae bacterium]